MEGPGCDSLSLTSSFDNDGEKMVYEQHLAQLQEQLVSAMIENQAVGKICIEDLSWVVSWDQPLLNEFNKVLFSKPLAS